VPKADNLTTILCHCHEIWEPYLPGTVWATPGLKWDCFTFDVEGFNLRKPNEPEVRKQYQIKFSKRFAALENLVIARTYIELGRTLKRISKSHLKRV